MKSVFGSGGKTNVPLSSSCRGDQRHLAERCPIEIGFAGRHTTDQMLSNMSPAPDALPTYCSREIADLILLREELEDRFGPCRTRWRT